MIELVRTFHPVGFGAFYVEKHSFNHETTTIVYDCGTKEHINFLKSIIREEFPEKGKVIDVLFISHFDKDHVSGIPFLKKHCKIKKVIIPYLSEEDRLLFVYAKKGLREYKQLIVNTENYFGRETKVYRVLSDSNRQHELDKSNEFSDNSQRVVGHILQSGVSLDSLNILSNWTLIPFNYDYAEQISKLKEKLNCLKLDYKRFKDENYICEHYKKIKKAYKELYPKSKQNDISLMLYSGTKTRNELFASYCGYVYHKPFFKLGCLYLGDVSLQKDGCMNMLRERLGNRMQDIGTIQIPHHGSQFNFDKEILKSGVLSVISCDFKSYNLPSDSVIKSIVEAGSQLFVVTHQKETKLDEDLEYK